MRRRHRWWIAVIAQLTPFALSAQPGRVPVGATDDDRELEAALPPLDPSAVAAPQPSAPLAPPTPTQEQELDAPLAPLTSFNAEPLPPTAIQQAKGDAPQQLRYQLRLEGFQEVGLDDRFRELSALLHDGKKAANATQIRARADEDVQLAERLLRSEGYFDGTALATIPAAVAPGAVAQVTITATPGKQYNLSQITLTGLAAEPHLLAQQALDLQRGQPIQAQRIQDAEARVSLRLPEQGYPFVEVGQRAILLDSVAFTGDYSLPVKAGPKSRFGQLRTQGDPVFAVDHLNVFPRFKAGQVYDSRQTDDLRQALIGTGLLSTVSVTPVRTGEIQPDGTETVDLLVQQVQGKARTLSASAGYGTGEGVKVSGGWAHNNLWSPEGALILDATAGTQQQEVSATFRRSNAGLRDRTFQAGVAVSRQRFDAYDAQSVSLTSSLSRQSTPIWQKRWTYSIGTELTASRETPFDPADLSRPKNTYFIAALPLQGGYDRSNSLLDPTRGFRVTAKLSPEAQKQSGGGFDTYARMLAETTAYLPLLSNNFVLAGRVRVGSIVGAARNDIAPSRRLYSGGGGSVRGYGYQQLGPKDQKNDPIGGRSLAEFSVEGRYRFGNYGIVPFFDGGRVGESSSPSISHMRYGVGIGARYYTNFGPFRLDVATPLGRRPGESKLGVYISIGQAF